MDLTDPTIAVPSLVLLVLCLTGAAMDLRSRRLPNWLSLLALITGLGFAIYSGGLMAAGSPLLHAFIALIGTMILFRFSLIGGGDAKFYTGLASWFALANAYLLLLCVAFAGAVLVVVMVIIGMFRRQSRQERRKSMSELPYGVAIACGTLASWYFVMR